MDESFLVLLVILSTITIISGDCPLYQDPEKEHHPCNRQCVEGQSMTCHYHFNVEVYYSMSQSCENCPNNISHCFNNDCVVADGYKKVIYTVNRRIPGPLIEVCDGDVVVVTIDNCMGDETTSVHWHGILQEGSQYMDGVPYVTQCPINPGTKFQVKFVARDWGTHFWHGHTGAQRCDGLFGGIIVRQPIHKTIHAEKYDEDRHVLLINDWTHNSGADKLMTCLHAGAKNSADNYLCNGMGRYYNDTIQVTHTPLYPINVKKGKRYRIRIIHAGCYDCPFELSIDNHNMTAIACDGHEIEEIETASMVMSPGERWDFILKADQPVGNYWMRITGLMHCKETKTHTVIPIHYKCASCEEPNAPIGYNIHPAPFLELNSLNVGRNTTGVRNIPELKAYHRHPKHDPRVLKRKPDQQIWMSFDFYKLYNPTVSKYRQTYTPQINHVSYRTANQPLLSQYCGVDPNVFCKNDTHTKCTSEYCECVMVYKVRLNTVCEVILVDNGRAFDANHPFHLHGYAFRVVAMDKLGSNCSTEAIMDMDRAGKIPRNLRNSPPFKDTANVPDGGYTILRFFAKNPGYWLFHCHLEIHYHFKMGLVIQVGEPKDFPPVPVGFPKCGDFNNNGKKCRKRRHD